MFFCIVVILLNDAVCRLNLYLFLMVNLKNHLLTKTKNQATNEIAFLLCTLSIRYLKTQVGAESKATWNTFYVLMY